MLSNCLCHRRYSEEMNRTPKILLNANSKELPVPTKKRKVEKACEIKGMLVIGARRNSNKKLNIL